MKQRQRETKVGRDGSDRDSKWSRRLVAIVLALLLGTSPLVAMPIGEPDDGDDSNEPQCAMTRFDWMVYNVSEKLRFRGMWRLRQWFVRVAAPNGYRGYRACRT